MLTEALAPDSSIMILNKQHLSSKESQPLISEIITQLFEHISGRRRKQLLVLIFVMILSSFGEVFSIAAVIPFIGLITNPSALLSNEYLIEISKFFGIQGSDSLLVFFTFIFVTLTVFSALIRGFSVWLQTRLTHLIGADLAAKAYKNTLHQSYEFHVMNNSSNLISTIFAKISTMLNRVVTPCLTIIHAIFMVATIVTGLFVLSPFVGISIFASLFFTYLIITFFIKRVVSTNGKIVANEMNNVMKKLQEGLGGIRDIIVDNTQNLFLSNFVKSDYPLRIASSKLEFISLSPRMLVEMIGVIIFAIVTFFLAKDDPSGNFVPLLAAIALGAVRLLPFMQGAYSGWSYINAHRFVASDVIEMLGQSEQRNLSDSNQIINFQKSIKIDNLSFLYQGSSEKILNNITLDIPKQSKVGIVGETGGGKSTLIDLIMGLLSPTNGSILIDEKDLNNSNIISWQSKISHVPQNIYLLDGSVYENIAFGLEKNDIDLEKVIECAKASKIHETISSLSRGYDTEIGERGSKLSGGQRQRIGIARALYKDSKVLFFDEATNALDSKTENEIMQSIYAYSKNITIFIIAHRISTLAECNIILEVKNKSINTYTSIEEFENKKDDAV